MRGKQILIILLLVLLSSNVFAAISENITNEFGAIKGTLDQSTENVLAKAIVFPEWISPFTNFLFGETISIERLIILVAIWMVLFIVIKSAVAMIPMFPEEKIQMGISAIVSLLVLITGTIDNLAAYYFHFLDTLKFLDNLGPAKIFLGVAILVLIVIGINKLEDYLSEKLELEKADTTGENISVLSSMGKIMSENMD